MCYVISTVTYYALTSELWLPETFVITLSVKVVPEMQLFYCLSGSLISSFPVVSIMRYVWDL